MDITAAPGRALSRRALLGLAAIICASALVYCFRLGDTGQNLYYAAGVRSMTESWHNFYYLAFDPRASLMIDKPPLGLWLQAGAVRVLGFHYWVLAVPQLLAGLAAIPLLFLIVRRRYGDGTALVAAGFLAFMPMSVAAARNNSVDTTTMLLQVVAAGCVLRALEGGRLRWISLAALAMALAFNVKMFEAFVPLPAFLLALKAGGWLTPARRRQLVVPAVILGTVSLSWVASVGFTPAAERPVVYNGYGNNIWWLTFRFNGIDRLAGHLPQDRLRATGGYTAPQLNDPSEASHSEPAGPLRLLTGELGSQVGWFLPVAIIGAAAMVRRRDPAQLMWLTWFGTSAVLFSLARDAKPQYLESLAPALAVCAAVGTGVLWRQVGSRLKRAAGVALVGTYSAALLALTSDDFRPLAVLILAASLGCAAWIVSRQALISAARGAVLTAVSAGVLLAGPVTWSVATAAEPATGSAARYPIGGPDDVRRYPPAPGGDAPGAGDPQALDPVIRFLEAQPASRKYLILTERALFGDAARYILLSRRGVLTLDSYETPAQAAAALEELVRSGNLRFVQLPAEGPWSDGANRLGHWFAGTCVDITSPALEPLDGSHLYDCMPAGS